MNYRKKQERRLDQALYLEGRKGMETGGMMFGNPPVTLPWSKIPEETIPIDGDTWGRWRLSMSHGIPSLDFGRYEIELSRIFTPGGILEWIEHLHGKIWGREPENMGNFVDAVLTIAMKGYMLQGKHVRVRERR